MANLIKARTAVNYDSRAVIKGTFMDLTTLEPLIRFATAAPNNCCSDIKQTENYYLRLKICNAMRQDGLHRDNTRRLSTCEGVSLKPDTRHRPVNAHTC